jgi:hypothetical protein
MCNLANPSLEKETPMRGSANSRSRALPRGVMGRLAKSARPRFVSRHAFALAMVGGLLLLGASAAAWATSTVRFDGVVSAPGTPSIVSSLPTGAAVDASARPSSSDPSGHVNAPSAVAFGHVKLGAVSGVTQTLSFTVGVGTTVGNIQALTLGIPDLDFTVVDGSTCTPGTTGTACTVNIQFLPRAPGVRRGAVVLYNNASPPEPLLTVPLYAIADSPLAALAPTTPTIVNLGSGATVSPFQIALDGAGNLYVGNYGTASVLKVAPNGGSASVAGTGGIALVSVAGVALDGAGNLFIADQGAGQVVVVTPTGTASVLSILGLTEGSFEPTALAVDASGNLFIADAKYGRIIKASSIDIAEGVAEAEGSIMGTGSYALGPGVSGVAVDAAGTVYIADPANSRVVQVAAGGVATLLLIPSGITPVLSAPQGVSVDGMGNIYIADTGNGRVVEVTTAGVASVVSTHGPNPVLPFGVTADPSGNLFIADRDNHRVVEVPTSEASLEFSDTRIGLTSPAQTATVTNIGNEPLIFAAHPTYTTDFSEHSGDASPCTSATTLSSGTACDVSVEFTPKSMVSRSAAITLTNNALNISSSAQQVSVSGTPLQPADTTATAVSAIPTTLIIGQTVNLTATVTDTTTGDTSNVPTGEVSFTDNLGSTLTSLNNGIGVNLNSTGQAPLTGVLLRGIGTHTIAAVYGGATNLYLTSTGTTPISVGQASVSLLVQPSRTVLGQTGSVAVTVTGPYTTIGAPSGTITYSILNASGGSLASGTIPLTVGSANSTATFPIPNTLAPGSYTVNVTYSGDANYLGVPTATPISFTVNKASPAVSLVSSLNPVFSLNPVTFTATVSSAAGTPTGSITFTDGQTLLSSVQLSQGVATDTTSSLAIGVHSIVATYSGDANFVGATSTTLTQAVVDFTLTVSMPAGEAVTPTVLPGGTLTYIVNVGPSNGRNFPSGVAFSTTGLPAGAMATFTPSTVAAGSPSANVSLAIKLAQQIVRNHSANPLGRGVALAMVGGMFLLPFGGKMRRSRRKAGRFIGLLILALTAICATVSLTGCGGTRTGYFGQQPTNFSVTLTATSGPLSHSTTVAFILE